MQQRFIYVVGRPDAHAGLASIVHALGYKLGVLLDEKLPLKHPEWFDRIEYVKFDSLDAELQRLDALNLAAAGLVCSYENYVIAKARLGAHFGVPAPGIASAKLSTDKSLMRKAFLDADRSITPDFSAVDSLPQALEFANTHGYPLIIKPASLVKSLLVLRCNSEQELAANFTYASKMVKKLYEQYRVFDRKPQLIIEEFITGKQCSVAAFVGADGAPHFCDGIAELTSAQDIDVDDNYLYRRILPGTFDPALASEMYRVAEVGIRALDMRSIPAHVELMYGAYGAKIIEIGARIGGYRPRMYKFSYGIDLNAAEVQLALGKTPDLKGGFRAYTAVYELFPRTVGAFSGISGPAEPGIFAYYRLSKKYGEITGPAKNGYKATVIIIIAEQNKVLFEQKCALVERMKVDVSP